MYFTIISFILVSDEHLKIGIFTKSLLNRFYNGGNKSPLQKRGFYDTGNAFYETTYDYALKKLIHDDNFLINA